MSKLPPSTNSLEVTAVANSAVQRQSDLKGGLIVAAALVALVLKLTIAFNTFGSNDVVTFYEFGRALTEHGLEWTYQHSILFNHPPLTALFLRAIYYFDHQQFFRDNGLTFPFLLRLPGIVADFVIVVAILWLGKKDARFRLPTWALALFALSPVSLMVSGFHGNTDPVMVMFLVLATVSALRGNSVMCGLFFALSCQIKIIAVLLIPIFFFYWLARRRTISFVIPFAVASLILWAEPLIKFPTLFIKNVFSYGSFWGIWGITYWLRLTALPQFARVSFFNLLPVQNIIIDVLKVLIIAAVFMIAWRRRKLGERGLTDSIAYVWIVFFVFAPGACAQYMVWLAPFILILSPQFYLWLTVTSTLFLFFFYNITAHGLPWYMAISTNTLNTTWTPWTIWPWTVLAIGMVLLWVKAKSANPALRLFSLRTLDSETRDQ